MSVHPGLPPGLFYAQGPNGPVLCAQTPQGNVQVQQARMPNGNLVLCGMVNGTLVPLSQLIPGFGTSQQTQYGTPQFPAIGLANEVPAPQREAVIRMPSAADLGGKSEEIQPWVRYPFFPTAPFYSTDPNVGHQSRYYTAQLLATDPDFAVGTEAIRRVQFDLPVRCIAQNGAAQITNNVALPVGYDDRNLFRYRLEYTQGDRLITAATLGRNVLGSAERPGELGGVGWTFDMGAAVILGITPLIAALNVDIAILCMELRGPANFVSPGAMRR